VRAATNATTKLVLRMWRRVDRDSVADSWRRMLPTVQQFVTDAQVEVAKGADAYLADLLDEYGIDDDPRGEFIPDSLAGVASDGRELASLLYHPAITTLFAIKEGATPARAVSYGAYATDLIVRTQIIDAARVSDGVALAARPVLKGWVRMLSLPSCSRCIVQAGRVFDWNDGFMRHPRCDCRHIPAPEDVLGDLRTDPLEAFNSMTREEQDFRFTKSGAQAIRDGANIGQVVNSRRGMSTTTMLGERRVITTVNAGRRRVRLMPEQIYVEAGGNRHEAIRLLRVHGYIR
jgi:hypothetical protein